MANCIATYLLCAAGAHQLIVDAALLDGINEIDHDLAIGNRWIIEVPQLRLLAGIGEPCVHPLHDLLLNDGIARVGQPRQNRQSVGAHQLPDQSCQRNEENGLD